MRFEIRRHRAARWDADQESWILGDVAETVRVFDAEYPALAQQAVEDLVVATRTETSSRIQRGKRVTLTTWLTTSEATQAWQTADGVLALVRVAA
jgi:hypothetical protein